MRKREIIFVVAFVVLVIVVNVIFSFNDHTYTVTVNDKDRIYNTNYKSSYYLIYCQDDQGNYYEFKDEDNILRLKVRSSTMYNQIEVGSKYKFTVVGFRIGILSSYENIIKMEKIE